MTREEALLWFSRKSCLLESLEILSLSIQRCFLPFDVWRLYLCGQCLQVVTCDISVGVTSRGEEATGRAQLINFPLSPRLEMQRMTQIRDRPSSVSPCCGRVLSPVLHLFMFTVIMQMLFLEANPCCVACQSCEYCDG